MQCPHCHAELTGNPVTCPQCRQKIRSLSLVNANRPAASPMPYGTPPPADARPQGITPLPADSRARRTAPPRPPMPRATPGGIAPAPVPQGTSTGKVGMILGYIGLGGWLLPIVGIPLSIVGLVFARKENHRAATILNICVLVVSIINAVLGAAM